MTEQTSDSLLALFDRAPLNRRYWRSFAIIAAGSMLDLFDFFIVGYLVAELGPRWHLTYGQSAIILLSGGIGAIISAPIWGSLSDSWGRKRQLVAGYLICAGGAGSISLIPDHAWQLFAALRFVVGFGLSAASVPALTMIVEITPTRFRTVVASLAVVFPTVGTLLSALTAATLLSALGWRGVAALGAAPVLVAVLAARPVLGFVCPAAAVLARGLHDGRSGDRRLRGDPVGTDDLLTVAEDHRRRGGALFRLCHSVRHHRQDRVRADAAMARAPPLRPVARVRARRHDRRRRLF
jgi:putative MFS transporter